MAARQLLQFASSSFMSDAHSACSITVSSGFMPALLQCCSKVLQAEERFAKSVANAHQGCLGSPDMVLSRTTELSCQS